MLSPGLAVDEHLLMRLMSEVSQHGATEAGGVHRPACTPADGAARDWLRAWWAAAGLRVLVDPIGNMFGLLEWAGPDAPAVMTGSHLDSQPNGGRYDGAYGVVAACAAMEAIQRYARQAGTQPRRNLVIANWTSEEGARFQPSLLGSSVYAGTLPLKEALARRDGEGVSIGEALAAIGFAGTAAAPKPVAYVELHVECGPHLETASRHFGVFQRYWGATKIRTRFIGAQAHTGPTPMRDRRDALLGAAYLIAELRALAGRAGVALHTSVGRIEVQPNSPNVVPGEATLFVELRSVDPVVLNDAEAEFYLLANGAAERAGVRLEIGSVEHRRPGAVNADLAALAERCARMRGHEAMGLDTVAAHDAVSMLAVCPSVVIAVPSAGGVCHHPSEFTTDSDLQLGAAILTDMLWQLLT